MVPMLERLRRTHRFQAARMSGCCSGTSGDLMRTHLASAYLHYATSVTHLSAGCQCRVHLHTRSCSHQPELEP